VHGQRALTYRALNARADRLPRPAGPRPAPRGRGRRGDRAERTWTGWPPSVTHWWPAACPPPSPRKFGVATRPARRLTSPPSRRATVRTRANPIPLPGRWRTRDPRL